MAIHQVHTDSGHMKGPENTLPMMAGKGPFGKLEMGGMFTVVKVRDDVPSDYRDPGWYKNPKGTIAWRVDGAAKRAPEKEMNMEMDPNMHMNHGG